MCRGCLMTVNGDNQKSTSDYVMWYAFYKQVLADMKLLNKKILVYKDSVDAREHKKILGKFHKKMVALRSEIGKADEILNEIELNLKGDIEDAKE